MLKGKDDINALSKAMGEYYGSITNAKRYSQYINDGLDFSSSDKLYNSVWDMMNIFLDRIPKLGLKSLTGERRV